MQCSSRIKLSKLDSSVLGLVLMFLFFTFIFMRRFHILSKEGHTNRKSKKMARQNKLQILLLNRAKIIAGVSSLGMPGVPWHTQILADQLTPFQPGGQIMPT